MQSAPVKKARPLHPIRKQLPKSIWQITSVIGGDVGGEICCYRISITRRGRTDALTIYTREGQPPEPRGLLERMARPIGGEAAIWTDGLAKKESMGGGYTLSAVPTEWNFPEQGNA